jgi:DNA-directed RNA polymerase subunit omega
MLNPSINDVLNKIDNRYYLVVTVAKRAREIIEGSPVYVSTKADDSKPVTLASKEITHDKITFRHLTQEEINYNDLKEKEAALEQRQANAEEQ